MANRILTISREFGSGGRTIGKMVAEKLGIPCYDSELLKKIAKESGFDTGYIQEAGEYAPGGFLSSAFSHPNSGPNNADYLWKIQYKIITDLAQQGPCVIRGTVCGLHSSRKSRPAAGFYPCGHEISRGENCKRIWTAGTVSRAALEGQG